MSPARVGRYELMELLGEGSMGRVHRARRLDGVGSEVAIKIVRRSLRARHAAARIEVERSVLARMDHPNLARVLDAGVDDDGYPWFAMELVDGPPLDRFCEIADPPLATRLELFRDVCHAVRHAHQKGVLHRDLKPANVLVATEAGHPVPKVIDFGIARMLTPDGPPSEHLTLQGEFVGTVDYMGPELLTGEAPLASVRSEVFALGVMLYELLAGSHPFKELRIQAGNLREAVTRLDRFVPAAPGVQRRRSRHGGWRVPVELDAITMRAIARRPEDRHPSVDALIEDLELFLAGEAPLTRPPGRVDRLRGSLRRHRFVTTIGVLLLAVLSISAHQVGQRLDGARASLAAAISSREATRDSTDLLRARDLVLRARAPWPASSSLEDNLATVDAWLDSALTLSASRLSDDDSEWQRLRQSIDDLQRQREVLEQTWPLWTRISVTVDPDGNRTVGIPPQLGLIPLGPDLDRDPPGSKGTAEIWLFAVGGTGELPRWLDENGGHAEYGSPGRPEIGPRTSLLMALLPGGTFLRDSQRLDPMAANYDPHSYVRHADGREIHREGPTMQTSLPAFFIAKTEATNHHYRQYLDTSTAEQPDYLDSIDYGGDQQPIVGIRWDEARSFCEHFGLQIPTEAQWEFATRAGSSTPFWCGTFEDGRWRNAWTQERAEKVTHPVATAPDGPFPNPWGLHNVIGNVHEFCADDYSADLTDAYANGSLPWSRSISGQRGGFCVIRGGTWSQGGHLARSAHRQDEGRHGSTPNRGVRPARRLTLD